MKGEKKLDTIETALQSQLRRDVLATLGAGAVLGATPAGAWAQSTVVGSAEAKSSSGLKTWSEYVDLLKPAGDLIDISWAPKSEQVRAELYRQLVMNISQAYFWYFQSDPDHPDWLPFENSVFMLQPNPDGIYHVAPVSGGGVYRVVGNRGGNRVMGFSVGNTMLGAADKLYGYNNYDFDGLTLAPDGSFEVVFSTERPKDWNGDWRYLHPNAGCLLVRQFSYDWGRDQEGRFAIERLDKAPFKPRPTIEDIAPKLDAMLGGFVKRLSKLWILYQDGILKKLGPNVLELSGFEDMGNSPEWPQKYWRGVFDIQPGEALIIETELPKKCKYWNVQINDILWNQVEFAYRQSSLNGHQARLDMDGKFRAVLALEDPGVPNWLDSGGFQIGTVIGRWHGANSYPLPGIRKVPVRDVRRYLPSDTPRVSPAEREKVLRERNIGVQLRRRW